MTQKTFVQVYHICCPTSKLFQVSSSDILPLLN